MPTVNEELLDSAVDHAVDFTRYNNGVVRRIIAVLNRADKDLFEQLTAALDRLPAESFTVERLDMLLQSVRRLNESAYTALQSELQVELKELVSFESSYQLSLFKNVLPVQVVVAAVNVEQVYSAALARPFQSRLLSEWAKSIEADRMVRIRDALRMGYVENQTIGQMVTRLRGTRARGYEDGLLEIDRRNAAAIVRTATAHTANFTRQRFYEENESLIKGLKWVSTLDSRTSPVCRARDGQVFPVNSGPRPPAHWNCRSCMSPVTKSWRELGIDLEDLPPSTRASMNGQVPEDMTYQDWLRKQSAARQDDILGKSKGLLFRKGELPLERFVDRNGKELTLVQLREKHAEAFRKAGL